MLNKFFRSNNKKTGMEITAHWCGADKSVTGSMHVIELKFNGKTTRFCVDAGMLQEDELLNHKQRLPAHIKAKDLDFIIFTHAHNDHIGHYPKLVRDGFKGTAYATKATVDFMKVILSDGGHIQEEDARERRKSKDKKISSIGPLYTQKDAERSVKLVKGMEMGVKFTPAKNVTVTFHPSSHLLGAAIVVLELGSGADKRTIVFSGDIGRKDMPCIKNATLIEEADYVICESTYGNRFHPERDRLTALADAVNRAVKEARNKHPVHGFGKIIIPSFAIGRAQWLLYDLRVLIEKGMIPNIPVFIDGPMSIKATEIYRKHAYLFPKADQKQMKTTDLFRTKRFAECLSKGDSKRLDEPNKEPMIIISSSGMASGGRVLGHLKEALQGSRNSVIFVGHQSEGTNGALLTTGAKSIRIDDEEVPVRATIELLDDFSAHGDYNDLMRWLSGFKKKPKHCFLVHGEEEVATAFKASIEEKLGWSVSVPDYRSSNKLT